MSSRKRTTPSGVLRQTLLPRLSDPQTYFVEQVLLGRSAQHNLGPAACGRWPPGRLPSQVDRAGQCIPTASVRLRQASTDTNASHVYDRSSTTIDSWSRWRRWRRARSSSGCRERCTTSFRRYLFPTVFLDTSFRRLRYLKVPLSDLSERIPQRDRSGQGREARAGRSPCRRSARRRHRLGRRSGDVLRWRDGRCGGDQLRGERRHPHRAARPDRSTGAATDCVRFVCAGLHFPRVVDVAHKAPIAPAVRVGGNVSHSTLRLIRLRRLAFPLDPARDFVQLH